MVASNIPYDTKDGAARHQKFMENYLDESLAVAGSSKGSRDSSQPDAEEATFEHVLEEDPEAEHESILK